MLTEFLKKKYHSYINTEMALAIMDNNTKTVKKYLTKGADPNFIFDSEHRFSLLQYAIMQENHEIVSLLLKYGADLIYVKPYSDVSFHTATAFETLLHVFSRRKEMRRKERLIMDVILKYIPIDRPYSNGYTMLQLAWWDNNKKMMQYLLDKGASPLAPCEPKPGQPCRNLIGIIHAVDYLADKGSPNPSKECSDFIKNKYKLRIVK